MLKRCREVYSTDCPFTSFKRRVLRQHHSSVHAHLPFTCKLCNFDFNSSKALKIHEVTAHRDSILTVKTEAPVSLEVEVQECLDDELETANNGFALNCGECDFKSGKPYDLRNHTRLVHDYIKWAESNGIDITEWQAQASRK